MPPIALELAAPDIAQHRASDTGTDYVHTFDSGRPGPHVLVQASGALANSSNIAAGDSCRIRVTAMATPSRCQG